jgi:hypothetical protein
MFHEIMCSTLYNQFLKEFFRNKLLHWLSTMKWEQCKRIERLFSGKALSLSHTHVHVSVFFCREMVFVLFVQTTWLSTFRIQQNNCCFNYCSTLDCVNKQNNKPQYIEYNVNLSLLIHLYNASSSKLRFISNFWT